MSSSSRLIKLGQFLVREEVIWTAGLCGLAWIDPTEPTHFSLCVFKFVHLPFCPGCGLGHAISYIFRGDFLQSLQSHPLGLPALLILVYRIVYLLCKRVLTKTLF